MKQVTIIHYCLMVVICTVLVIGCADPQGSRFDKTSGTSVNLEKGNYTMVRPAARGTSVGFKLLGIIPFKNPTYAEAKNDLYENLGQSLTGRPVALANQSEDKSTLYLILFSLPRLTLSADVIEFKEEE